MTIGIRRKVSILMLVGALLHGTVASAAADYSYFRLKSPTGQVTDTNPPPPPPQGQISYFVLGPQSGTVGQSYAASSQVTGATGTVAFSLFSGALPAGVVLEPETGSISGVPTQAGSFSAILRAYDSGSASAALAQLAVTVSPVFSLVGVASGVGTVGSSYSAQFNGSGGSTPYSFFTASVLPPGLALASTTGVLAGVPSQAGTYPNISISGQDAAGRTASSAPFTMVVSDPLSMAWTAAAGRQGDAYSSAPSASGGHAPLFYVLNGALPNGLHFSGSTGAITGTPTVSGDFQVQIAVGDQDGRSAATSYETISIAPAHVEQPLAIAGTPPTSGQVDVAYAASFSAAGGSGAGYSFDLVGAPLPDGLTLNADGSIAGAPTTAGTYSGIQVQVTDSEANTALSNSFSIIVAPAPALMISGNPSPSAQVGMVYSANFTAFEGSGAGYSFSSVGAPLPPGLTLTQVTQAQVNLTGTPTYVGTYSGLQIRAIDSKGHVADSSPFAITVAAPAGAAISISGTPQAWADVGIAYSAKMNASGGTGQGYAFSLASGALPDGLQLFTDGTIAGTPQASGTASFTVQLIDSAGDVTSNNYSIAVASQLVIAGNPAANVFVGSSYSAQFSSTGGTAPIVYSLASGVLPSWLTLDGSSGLLAGTPSSTDVGTVSSLAVQATSGAGETAISPVFSIDVVAETATASLSSPAEVRSGAAITGTISTNLPGASWSFGSAPFGLSLVATSANSFAGAAPAVSSPTVYTVTAIASAGGYQAAASTFNVTVDPALTIAGGPSGTITGVANIALKDSAAPSVTGVLGTASYSLTKAGAAYGTLSSDCPGLTFSDGQVSGTPTAACSVSGLTVRVVDDHDGASANTSAPFAIAISAATASLSFSTSTVRSGGSISGTVNSNYTSPSWTFTQSPSTPAFALTVNGSSVFGTAPTVPSQTSFSVTAKATAASGGGTVNSTAATLTVVPGLTISGGPSGTVSGTAGTALTATSAPTVNNLIGAASYSLLQGGSPVTIGLLCPGLTFSATNGQIAGTPSASCSQANFTVKVIDSSDSSSATTTTPFMISIAAAPAAPTGSFAASGIVGNAYSSGPLSASGGSGTYTWSLAGGSLPPGLSLTSSGIISGTPSAVGAFTFTVGFTDGVGAASPASATQTIAIAAANASASLTSGSTVRSGDPVTGTMSSNLANQSWSTVQTTPASPLLNLSYGSSTFSGTAPSVSSPTAFSFNARTVNTATSADATSGAMAMTVNPALAISGGVSGTISGTVGTSIASTSAPTATGVVGTKSFAIMQSGTAFGLSSVCPGLSLDTTSGIISGTPSNSCLVNSASLRVTDSSDGRTADGTLFNISITIPSDYLVVGGGGGGGGGVDGGGGAGGGVQPSFANLSTGSYPVIVGPGGAGGAASTASYGANGGNSSFNATTAFGGGGGAPEGGAGLAGGAGGGAGGSGGQSGGAGTAGQGYAGGSGTTNFPRRSGGGGGAGSAGISGLAGTNPGKGGDGYVSGINVAFNQYYGGGGAGGQELSSVASGGGGLGGGGTTTGATPGNGVNGTDGLGGGGGGASRGNGTTGVYAGGKGGSGSVTIRYRSPTVLASGGTITQTGGYVIHTFTSSGTFTVH